MRSDICECDEDWAAINDFICIGKEEAERKTFKIQYFSFEDYIKLHIWHKKSHWLIVLSMIWHETWAKWWLHEEDRDWNTVELDTVKPQSIGIIVWAWFWSETRSQTFVRWHNGRFGWISICLDGWSVIISPAIISPYRNQSAENMAKITMK